MANIVEGGRGRARGAAARPVGKYAAMTARGSDSDASEQSGEESAEVHNTPHFNF